jgi:alkylhydroperoxidase family enzyme
MSKSVKIADRLQPVGKEKLMEDHGELFALLPTAFSGKSAPVNVFGVLQHRPEIAEYFFPYWVYSKLNLKLSLHEQELIILRMAVFYQSQYVWGQHARLIKEAGIGDVKLQQLALPIEKGNWTPDEAILLYVTDEILKTANISDQNWEQLTKYYSQEQVLDIITVVSQYVLFCSVNNIFRIPLEHEGFSKLPHLE